MVGSVPPRPAGREPAALLAMITPMAPAFCAFFNWITKPRTPRLIRAMRLPRAFRLWLSKGSQPLHAPAVWSDTGMICPITGVFAWSGWPNEASPGARWPAAVPAAGR